MEIRAIISGILIFSGCFLIVIASIGVVRFPDFYSRIHPAGKSDSMGLFLTLLGLMVYEGFTFVSVKLGLIIVFIYIANPTATYALAKAAYIKGVPHWQKDSDKKEDGNGD